MQFPIVGWGLTVSKIELFIEVSQIILRGARRICLSAEILLQ